jgi:tetratricopeptide (TPR) repeat protein
MRGNAKIIVIIASIVLSMILQGCDLKNTSSLDKFNGTQKVESVQPLPAVTNTDPVKVAESEEFFKQGLKFYEEYKYQQSIANFDKAIAANPANFKVYTAKGIALCFEEDYKSGMALIQKTLDMNPDYVPAFYDMAMAYKLQNDYDKALFWFEKTIQGDPKNTWSYYGIATIYADRGNTQQALTYLEKAVELDQGVKAVAKQQSHFDQMRNLPEFKALVR